MSASSLYLVAAGVLAGALGLCLVAMLRGPLLARLVALEMAAAVTVLVMTVLAVAFHRAAYLVAPLVLACLSAPGALIFANVIERWLLDPSDDA